MVSGQYRFLEATYVEPAFIATGISRVRMSENLYGVTMCSSGESNVYSTDIKQFIGKA